MNYNELLDKINELNNILDNQNEINNIQNHDIEYNKGFKKGVTESFNIFRSTLDFYNIYKNNVSKLMKEQNKLWKTWVKYYNTNTGINKSNYNEKYNNWLFKYLLQILDINKENELLELY